MASDTTAPKTGVPARSGPRTLRQLVSYTLIGGSGVLIDLLVFLLLHDSAGLDEQVANVLSTTLGIVNNFVLNALFTFGRRDRIVVRFLRFYAVGLTGMAVTWLLFHLFTGGLGIDADLVKLGSLPVVLALQFVLNRKWSFG